jgi:hypothetical protein
MIGFQDSKSVSRPRFTRRVEYLAVAAARGWNNLDLGHGFHATKQGERYMLSESARRTVLDRLLALNHQRYEEEVKTGLHDKGVKKAANKKKKSAPVPQGEQIRLRSTEYGLLVNGRHASPIFSMEWA